MSARTTKRADRDIIELFVYGANRFGIAQAEHYNRGLMNVFDMLANHPRMARLRLEFTPPVRIHAYQLNVVVYVEDANDIVIVRVLHGRQDWERALS